MSQTRIEAFRSMLVRAPDNAMARYGLANELFKAARFTEAIEALKEYLAVEDDQGSAFRILAQCYEKLDCREEALDAYRRGVEAATLHGHPGMADEYRMRLEDLEDA